MRDFRWAPLRVKESQEAAMSPALLQLRMSVDRSSQLEVLPGECLRARLTHSLPWRAWEILSFL